MAVQEKVYVDDIGTLIRINMQESLTELESDVFLYVKKPNGNIVTWGEVVENPVTISGDYLEYIIADGDLDIAGDYIIQPYGTINDWIGRGTTTQFTVYGLFK